MVIKSGVTVKLDRVPDVLAGLRYLDTSRVMVGIPSKTAGRKEGPINNAAIGFIQENGDPEMNLPARPFLVPGVGTIRSQAADLFKKAGRAVLDGDVGKAIKIYNAVGLLAQNAVRRKITDGPFAPLSPRTIAKRRARGVTRTKPLIDTGQLRAAVTYIIRKIKGIF